MPTGQSSINFNQWRSHFLGKILVLPLNGVNWSFLGPNTKFLNFSQNLFIIFSEIVHVLQLYMCIYRIYVKSRIFLCLHFYFISLAEMLVKIQVMGEIQLYFGRGCKPYSWERTEGGTEGVEDTFYPLPLTELKFNTKKAELISKTSSLCPLFLYPTPKKALKGYLHYKTIFCHKVVLHV